MHEWVNRVMNGLLAMQKRVESAEHSGSCCEPEDHALLVEARVRIDEAFYSLKRVPALPGWFDEEHLDGQEESDD